MASFVTTHGPLFDGRAAHAMREFCDDWEQSYAEEIQAKILERFASVFKHPTGKYESTIHVAKAGPDTEVTDRRSVYGPWLEGTGSRNRTTRFKGYRTFRIIGQEAEAKAGADANELFQARYLRRMQ